MKKIIIAALAVMMILAGCNSNTPAPPEPNETQTTQVMAMAAIFEQPGVIDSILTNEKITPIVTDVMTQIALGTDEEITITLDNVTVTELNLSQPGEEGVLPASTIDSASANGTVTIKGTGLKSLFTTNDPTQTPAAETDPVDPAPVEPVITEIIVDVSASITGTVDDKECIIAASMNTTLTTPTDPETEFDYNLVNLTINGARVNAKPFVDIILGGTN